MLKQNNIYDQMHLFVVVTDNKAGKTIMSVSMMTPIRDKTPRPNF